MSSDISGSSGLAMLWRTIDYVPFRSYRYNAFPHLRTGVSGDPVSETQLELWYDIRGEQARRKKVPLRRLLGLIPENTPLREYSHLVSQPKITMRGIFSRIRPDCQGTKLMRRLIKSDCHKTWTDYPCFVDFPALSVWNPSGNAAENQDWWLEYPLFYKRMEFPKVVTSITKF